MVGIFKDFDDGFLEPVEDAPLPEELKSDLPADMAEDIQRYLKVGLYCGWSWQDYEKTSVLVVDEISKEIDRRLKPYIDAIASKAASGTGKKGKALLPLDFNHLGILLALASAFGGSED